LLWRSENTRDFVGENVQPTGYDADAIGQSSQQPEEGWEAHREKISKNLKDL
jgi:hypothetical protein